MPMIRTVSRRPRDPDVDRVAVDDPLDVCFLRAAGRVAVASVVRAAAGLVAGAGVGLASDPVAVGIERVGIARSVRVVEVLGIGLGREVAAVTVGGAAWLGFGRESGDRDRHRASQAKGCSTHGLNLADGLPGRELSG